MDNMLRLVQCGAISKLFVKYFPWLHRRNVCAICRLVSSSSIDPVRLHLDSQEASHAPTDK